MNSARKKLRNMTLQLVVQPKSMVVFSTPVVRPPSPGRVLNATAMGEDQQTPAEPKHELTRGTCQNHL